MSPEQIDLARRLVARPEWRWLVGMRTDAGATVTAGQVALLVDGALRTSQDEAHVYLDPGVLVTLPDLTDDATGGVLLGLVRERATHIGLEWLPSSATVDWYVGDEQLTARGPTLAEAAARALLACWEAADANR